MYRNCLFFVVVKHFRRCIEKRIPYVISKYHFSTKRCEELKEFQTFVGAEKEKMLKHCPTRWLSLKRCVERLISQFSALKSYFGAQKGSDNLRNKIGSIFNTLSNPLQLPWLHFLKLALLPYQTSNMKFQVCSRKVLALFTHLITLKCLPIVLIFFHKNCRIFL